MTQVWNRVGAARAILLGAVLLLGWSVARGADEAAPKKAPAMGKWERHYYDRVARFERENLARKNIVMVGSSHIEGFDASRLLPGRRIVNRGISSDRIGIDDRGVLHRLENSVFDCDPGVVILENGVNDLGELHRHGRPSVDQIDVCYREVVKRIRTRLPDVPLVIVGLFPTGGRYADLGPLVVEFNQRLAKIAADHGCRFIDVYAPFVDSAGHLRQEYSRDGLHLTEAGYRVWAELIEAALVLELHEGDRKTQ
ncbi:MAG: hypothetical protein GY842_23130 [bacterium]|nr:hypothetical protein [bacterium]